MNDLTEEKLILGIKCYRICLHLFEEIHQIVYHRIRNMVMTTFCMLLQCNFGVNFINEKEKRIWAWMRAV